MGLLLDIVPNHMAASAGNPWWMDVLEYGRESFYAPFFDIDWDAPGSKSPELQKDRVVVPNLPDLYESVLTKQGIVLHADERGFYADVEGNRFPIAPATYRLILEPCLESLNRLHSRQDETAGKMERLMAAFGRPASQQPDHRESMDRAKAELWDVYQNIGEVREVVDGTLRLLNVTKGEPASFDRLHWLLSPQFYRLAYWRTAGEEVNYRRFFGAERSGRCANRGCQGV